MGPNTQNVGVRVRWKGSKGDRIPLFELLQVAEVPSNLCVIKIDHRLNNL